MIGFVGLDDLAFATKWRAVILHRLTDAVFHEPRSVIGDAKRAVQLVCAVALL